ncbi:unnamed protein product [Prunus brigantina]
MNHKRQCHKIADSASASASATQRKEKKRNQNQSQSQRHCGANRPFILCSMCHASSPPPPLLPFFILTLPKLLL